MKYFKNFNQYVNEDVANPKTPVDPNVQLDSNVIDKIRTALKDFTEKNALRFNFQNRKPEVNDTDLRKSLMPESVGVVDELDKVCASVFTDANLSKVVGLVINVDGYTSSKGDTKFNQELSVRRAKIVVTHITNKYKAILDKYKVTFNVIGHGENNLIITNDYFGEPPKNMTPLLDADVAKLDLSGVSDANKFKTELNNDPEKRQAVNRRVYITLPGTTVKPEPEPNPTPTPNPPRVDNKTDVSALVAPPITFNWNSIVPSNQGFSDISTFITNIDKYNKEHPNNKKTTLYVITHVRVGESTVPEEQNKELTELSYNRGVFLARMIYQLNQGLKVVVLPTLAEIKNEPGCIFDFDANNEVVKKALSIAPNITKKFGGDITINSNYIVDEHIESAERDIRQFVEREVDVTAQSVDNNYRRIPVEYLYILNNEYHNKIIAKCLEPMVKVGHKAITNIIKIIDKAAKKLGYNDESIKQKFNILSFSFKERQNTELYT